MVCIHLKSDAKKIQLVLFLLLAINILEYLFLPIACGKMRPSAASDPWTYRISWIWLDSQDFGDGMYITALSFDKFWGELLLLVGLSFSIFQIVLFFKKIRKDFDLNLICGEKIFQFIIYYNLIIGGMTILLNIYVFISNPQLFMYNPLEYALFLTNSIILLIIKKILHVSSDSGKVQGIHLFFHVFFLVFLIMLLSTISSYLGLLFYFIIGLPLGIVSPVNACIYYIKTKQFRAQKKITEEHSR